MDLKQLILCVVLACAAAQFGGFNPGSLFDRFRERFPFDDTIDSFHGWRLEDHHYNDSDHILLFIRDMPPNRECYVIEVSRRLERYLDNEDNINRMTEEIYQLVNDPNHRERDLTTQQLSARYNDVEATTECDGHESHIIRYNPSWAPA